MFSSSLHVALDSYCLPHRHRNSLKPRLLGLEETDEYQTEFKGSSKIVWAGSWCKQSRQASYPQAFTICLLSAPNSRVHITPKR